ncbi:hypothetical protein ACX27_04250 [Nostoc piscinale CENA21]|uniref:DUF4054 domain-containing protein n=1 Tax=Nostoc piscinale CENA21 TaxID=224013 RepID=A0A0M5MKG8_9NOSO|nr:DUF4054 domain-containing protein [Nostoc piscinale]ALF52242.1 hypothetical protein ACX27_04250 [Nostoc piscinale CENA21]
MITPSDFLANYDEFQTLEESKIQAAINEAAVFCPADVWQDKRALAVSLVTAHILAMRWLQIGAIAASAVQNAKGKDANNRMDSDSWFTGTVWGQQYLQMRRGLPVSGFVI